jgi:outer membrane protein
MRDAAAVQAARWQARQASLVANKELERVIQEVRDALLQSLRAERQITETENEIASAREELRLSKIRFEHGLGNNIDIITAQRDLTNALVSRAQAMIGFNIAQAQLLRDVGVISVDSLSSGATLQ